MDELSHISVFDIVKDYLSIEYHGCVGTTSGIDLMIETISRDVPAVPSDFSFEQIKILRNLGAKRNSTLDCRMMIVRIDSPLIRDAFSSGELILTAGSNITKNGLIIQLNGSPAKISTFVKSIRELVPIRRISTNVSKPQTSSSDLDQTQKKVILTAFSNGYYESPKKTSMRQLAALLDMSKSSVSAHLSSAENRLIEKYFQGP